MSLISVSFGSGVADPDLSKYLYSTGTLLRTLLFAHGLRNSDFVPTPHLQQGLVSGIVLAL